METPDDGVLPRAHVVVTSTPPADPPGLETDEARPPRRTAAVSLAVVLSLAVVVTLLLTLAVGGQGDDEVVGTREPSTAGGAPAGGAPADPAPLGLTVDAPPSVQVGETATVTVTWSDGSGLFSGSSEDWGDGVGTSSLQQERCDPAAQAPDPATGSYQAEHSWSTPGRYPVVIGVTTYVCRDGTAVFEDASRTVTIEVHPAG